MTDIRKLSDSEKITGLSDLNQSSGLTWQIVDDKLHIELRFPTFPAAIDFIQQAALEAEAMDHHPEWCNTYNRLTINLVTHSVSGISRLDFELAERMNRLFTRFSSSDSQ